MASQERTRRRAATEHDDTHEKDFSQPSAFEVGETTLDIDDISDEELEALYFADEDDEESSLLNIPTIAGLSLIMVGIMYLLGELGVWVGPDLSALVAALPFIAGVLIILLGFGVLSWRPGKKKKAKKKAAVEAATGKKKVVEDPQPKEDRKRRLTRSRADKKLFGVCGGLADYLNLDPTLVRIAFVIGVIASGGPFVLAYLALAFVMPKEPPLSPEERISIIRDS